MEIKNLRINNLEFRKSTYLDERPKHSSYDICMWKPNPYYGKESEYEKIGTHYFPKNGAGYSIHESCFKNPESRYVLGSFVYNDDFYEFHFCMDLPIDMDVKYREDFWKLLEYGNEILNFNDKEE